MPQLPSAADLGQANPGSGERPVGQINAEPIARGYERLGAGLAQAGQGVGELEQSKARYDFALAHGGFVSDMIGLNEKTSRDLNYGPDADGQDLSQRYETQAKVLRDKWGAGVGNPAMRQLFTERTNENIAEGQARADTHAFGLYRDHQVAAADTLGEDLGNKAVATDDPKVHQQVMDAYGGAVDGLAGRGMITQDQAVAKKRAFGGNLAHGLLLQQAQTDPQGALNHIRAAPGSDAELVERFIQVESGGDPNAKDPNSTAAGLASFTAPTWLDLIKSQHPELAKGRSDQDLLALRADPGLQREMTGALIAQNRASLQRQGLEPSAGNLYLSHFLGAGGAAALLKAKPDTPVSELLDPKAIAANPGILAGRTAGSVEKWAGDKMGGYSPGEGSIYSFIPPAQRAQLEARLSQMSATKRVSDRVAFQADQQDAESEALNTGDVKNPIAQERFIAEYGPTDGPRRFQDYDVKVQTGKTIAGFAQMTPGERQSAIESLTPTPGEPGEAVKWQAKKVAEEAASRLEHEIKTDPAAFAQRRLPAVQDAWANLQGSMSGQNTMMTPENAARAYVATTAMEQRRVGIAPGDQRILPEAYVKSFDKEISAAADSDNPQSRVGLIARVQQEARLWGDHWPAVMRELAPTAQPIVRTIAAGADPAAMTRLLSLSKDETPKKIVGESDAKFADLGKALNTEMQPFLGTLVGSQKDRDYPGYYGLAEKLTALGMRDGKSADVAAHDAFNALVGNRYDFRDTFRIPKSSGVSADDVQHGAYAARGALAELGVKPAVDDIGLSDNRGDSLAKFGRDGAWVTAPDNSGLNLVYGDKFVRREGDGKPLLLPWADLAARGKGNFNAAIAAAPAAPQ